MITLDEFETTATTTATTDMSPHVSSEITSTVNTATGSDVITIQPDVESSDMIVIKEQITQTLISDVTINLDQTSRITKNLRRPGTSDQTQKVTESTSVGRHLAPEWQSTPSNEDMATEMNKPSDTPTDSPNSAGASESAERYPNADLTTEQYPSAEQTSEQNPSAELTTKQYPSAEQTSDQNPSVELTTEQYLSAELTVEPESSPAGSIFGTTLAAANLDFVPGPREGPVSPLYTSSSSTKKSSSHVPNIIAGVVVSVVLVTIVVGAAVFVYWKCKVSSQGHLIVMIW